MQPEKDTKDERLLGPHSHLAIDVYDNAMFVGAIDDFLHLCNATQHTPKVTPSPVCLAGALPTHKPACLAMAVPASLSAECCVVGAVRVQRDWSALRAKTAAAVRAHLWNATADKFTP